MKYVAAACDAEQLTGSPDAQVGRVCTDSRQVQRGDLFFAIKGDRFDGHDFLAETARKGAVALVVARERVPQGLPCAVLGVDDPRRALGRLAARYRADFTLPVVAVGGSNGKTTTKELVAAVLRRKFATLWSEASFNNDIGVPMTLLGLEKSHQAAVLEIGTNHPGELAPLARMVQPGYGIITNIGREHLEFFDDLAGVAREEGMLAEALPADGKLFINGDGEWADQIVRRTQAGVSRVGVKPGNDWRLEEASLDAGGMKFRISAPHQEFGGEYRIGLLGRHQALNAVFAIATGAELGVPRAEIERGLAECKPARMRLQVWTLNGVTVLDDAYNANADSMRAALETLREMPCEGRRVAVLGDMAELGRHSAEAHEEIGRRAAESGVNRLFTIGKMAPLTAGAAKSAGLREADAWSDMSAAAEAVKQFLHAGDVLLLKASRSTRLERLGEALRSSGAREKV